MVEMSYERIQKQTHAFGIATSSSFIETCVQAAPNFQVITRTAGIEGARDFEPLIAPRSRCPRHPGSPMTFSAVLPSAPVGFRT